jgi:hypothetical protein
MSNGLLEYSNNERNYDETGFCGTVGADDLRAIGLRTSPNDGRPNDGANDTDF